MHINYVNNKQIESIDVDKYGDVRTEVEQALQRFFHNDTAKVRAGLVAAGVSDLNKAHPHSERYEQLADDMTVEVEDITHTRRGYECEATRVTITMCGHNDTAVEHCEVSDKTPIGVEAKVCEDCDEVIEVF